MFRQNLKSFVVWTGLVLLAGLLLLNWESGRLEAASPSGSAPVLQMNPRLFVDRLKMPNTPDPSQVNDIPVELLIGIQQNARVKNSIHGDQFQPLDQSSLKITPLEGSVEFKEVDCGPVGGDLSGKFVRCSLVPPAFPAPPPDGFWGQPGLIQIVIELATADGDVAESYRSFAVTPPPPPPGP